MIPVTPVRHSACFAHESGLLLPPVRHSACFAHESGLLFFLCAETPGWSSLKSALSDCPKRLALLPVRGVDSELGEGEETGPFGETDADGVGVDFVETMHLHAALSRCGPTEDRMPGTFVEIFNDIFLHYGQMMVIAFLLMMFLMHLKL